MIRITMIYQRYKRINKIEISKGINDSENTRVINQERKQESISMLYQQYYMIQNYQIYQSQNNEPCVYHKIVVIQGVLTFRLQKRIILYRYITENNNERQEQKSCLFFIIFLYFLFYSLQYMVSYNLYR